MANCIITKFNSVAGNQRLQPLGTMKISVSEIESPSASSQALGLEGNGHTVTVNADGYFALSYAGLSDPSSRLTSYTLSGSSAVTLYFKNGNYDIFISGKYNNTSLKTVMFPTNTDVFSVDVDEFAYCDAPFKYDFEGCKHASGNVRSLIKGNLYTIFTNNTNIVSAPILEFGKVCVRIANLVLDDNTEKSDIIDFVDAQKAINRTTNTSGIRVKNIGRMSTFNNQSFTFDGDSYIKWDATKIWIEATDKVVAYGASAAEIAAWEQAGKTVVVIT